MSMASKHLSAPMQKKKGDFWENNSAFGVFLLNLKYLLKNMGNRLS